MDDNGGRQQYCNYPEISKKPSSICSVSDEWSSSLSHITSISDVPSVAVTVTDPPSETVLRYQNKYSPSLVNFFQASVTASGATSYVTKETLTEALEKSNYEESVLAEGSTAQKRNIPYLSSINNNSWMKFSFDTDPWNEENYKFDYVSLLCNNGILNRQIVSKCTSTLVQLPNTNHFVFSRLHLNNKDLHDISVLSEYRYFQYIDLSWNHISNIAAINNCMYLMYLNVAHNKLSTVLDFTPPWFLTHVNLSCNQIREIGDNLANFWSLRHIDLSYNNIEKVNEIKNLKYLRYLNISHNHIKKIENLDCINVEELYLQYNEISDVGVEESGLNSLKSVKIINISRNKMSQLHIFKDLYTLEELDISENCVSNLGELEILNGFQNLVKLNLAGNNICSTVGYRELITYKLPSLKLLDSLVVDSSDKVSARMLFDPDVFTRTHHTRAKLELCNQIAGQMIDMDTAPCNQFPNPIIILVGTLDNGKEELAKVLSLHLPYQVYRFKKYTTMSSNHTNDDEQLISISVDEFNNMIKSGKFLSYYKETGFFFGICRDDLCHCIVEGKVGLVDTNLEAALVLKSSGLCPVLVLCVVENIQSYAEKLGKYFMKFDLSCNYFSVTPDKCSCDSNADPSEVDSCEEISFKWTWSLESSVTAESIPDENYLLMLKQKEKFVASIIKEQSQYIELNNEHPSLFMATVCTDNKEASMTTIEETCFNIFDSRDHQMIFKHLTDSEMCKKFIENRVDYLLENLINVYT